MINFLVGWTCGAVVQLLWTKYLAQSKGENHEG